MPPQYLLDQIRIKDNLLVANGRVTENVDGVVGQHIKPVEGSVSDDVLEVVLQKGSGIDHTVHGVEAIGLNNLSGIITETSFHSFVLKTLGEAVEPGGGTLGINCSETVERLGVVRGTHSGGTKSLVGHFTFFIEKTDETLSVDLLEVVLCLVDTLLGVFASSVDRNLQPKQELAN